MEEAISGNYWFNVILIWLQEFLENKQQQIRINFIFYFFLFRTFAGSHITDVTSSQTTSHDQSNRESHYNPAIENYSDSLRD